MENAAQTQPNVRNVRSIQFYAKNSLAKKPDRVQNIYRLSVKVTHKNVDQTQIQNGTSSKRTPVLLIETGVRKFDNNVLVKKALCVNDKPSFISQMVILFKSLLD